MSKLSYYKQGRWDVEKLSSPCHKVAGQQASLGLVQCWFCWSTLHPYTNSEMYICVCISTYLHAYIFIFIPPSSVMAIFSLYHLKAIIKTTNYHVLLYVQHYVESSTYLISFSHPNRKTCGYISLLEIKKLRHEGVEQFTKVMWFCLVVFVVEV